MFFFLGNHVFSCESRIFRVRYMLDSGLVDRYLQRSLAGNRTKTKNEPTAMPLDVRDVEGHLVLLLVGLCFAALTELLKSAIHLLVLQSRLRKRNNNAAITPSRSSSRGGYTLELMVIRLGTAEFAN